MRGYYVQVPEASISEVSWQGYLPSEAPFLLLKEILPWTLLPPNFRREPPFLPL